MHIYSDMKQVVSYVTGYLSQDMACHGCHGLLVIGVHVYLFPAQLFLLESEQQWTVPCTAE